jgi:hypothetical protein
MRGWNAVIITAAAAAAVIVVAVAAGSVGSHAAGPAPSPAS